jgi:hypothetical protein
MTSAALIHFTACPTHLTRTYRALLQVGQFQTSAAEGCSDEPVG